MKLNYILFVHATNCEHSIYSVLCLQVVIAVYLTPFLIKEFIKMTDVDTKKIVTISDLPPEILETLFPLLDFVCLKSCRLVCKSWEVFSRNEMMKRSAFNLCKTDVYNEKDKERAGLYSSWKINNPRTFLRYFEHPSNLEDRNVKYNKIHFTLPFRSQFWAWLQQVLTIDCPNIEELAFDFEFRKWRVETGRDFFIEYFTDDTCLPFIRTLRFFRIASAASCEFAMTLIAACPNLEHLYFTEIARSGSFHYRELSNINFHEWDVLSRLAKMPEVTGKLKTIEWTVNTERNNFEYYRQDYVNVDGGISQELKFSENLQRLQWDVMRIKGGKNGGIVLRVVLQSVAGSLKELSFRKGFHAGSIPIESLGLPVLQNLSKLQMGIEAYATVAISELVDAAPNLTRLEIIDDKEYRRCHTIVSDLWGTSPKEMKPHPNLKTFLTEVGFEELSVFEKTLKKFPNLKRLYVGACQLELSGAFNTLKDNARQLEHFYWVTQRKLHLSQLCDHLVLDVAKLSTWGNLKYYCLEYAGNQGYHSINISEDQQRKEEIWQGMKGMRMKTRVIVLRPFTMCNCGDRVEDDTDAEYEVESESQYELKAQRCDALNELERFIRESEQIPIYFVEPEYDINQKRRLIF
jgi:hypothetical protein